MDPERFRENRDHEDYEKFKFLCLALCVLVDDGRREVYDKHGLSGLARSEKYSQVDVFDVDPLQVFDNFFDCKNMSGSFDEDIKQYLLFEAGGGGDDDDDERVDVPAYAGREKRPRIRSDAIEPPPNPPPSIGTAAALMMKRSLLSSYSSEKGGGDVWTKLVSAHPNNNT